MMGIERNEFYKNSHEKKLFASGEPDPVGKM